MNKTLLISIGGALVAGLLALAYWISSSQGQVPTNNSSGQSTGLPVAGSVKQTPAVTTSSQNTGISSVGTDGGSVQTIDFIKDPATVQDPLNAGYYYLGYHMSQESSDPTASDNPPYIITYISSTQYFNIALLQEPIGTVRLDMEQYLAEHLGLSQDQLCQLNYMVSVPEWVNSQYAGKNLGFSFCPGATVLPK